MVPMDKRILFAVYKTVTVAIYLYYFKKATDLQLNLSTWGFEPAATQESKLFVLLLLMAAIPLSPRFGFYIEIIFRIVQMAVMYFINHFLYQLSQTDISQDRMNAVGVFYAAWCGIILFDLGARLPKQNKEKQAEYCYMMAQAMEIFIIGSFFKEAFSMSYYTLWKFVFLIIAIVKHKVYAFEGPTLVVILIQQHFMIGMIIFDSIIPTCWYLPNKFYIGIGILVIYTAARVITYRGFDGIVELVTRIVNTMVIYFIILLLLYLAQLFIYFQYYLFWFGFTVGTFAAYLKLATPVNIDNNITQLRHLVQQQQGR